MKQQNHLQDLDFNKINQEIKEYYANLEPALEFSEKDKKKFFKERNYTLNRFIQLLTESEKIAYPDIQIYYSTLGIFYELLIKTCLLKENWNNFTVDYKKENNQNFGYAKTQLLESLKEKITKEQADRIRQVLDFVQIQRDNFVHSPFKGFSHYTTEQQVYLVPIVLNKLYNLNLNVAPFIFETDNSDLGFEMPKWLDFKSVGFEKVFKEKKTIKQKQNWQKTHERKKLMQRTESMSPTDMQTEEIDGTFYPQDLDTPAIEYIQHPEPHVLITDWSENPQEWYNLLGMIPSLANQAFTCYYRGMYQASFLVSVNCIELTLKFELLKKAKIKPIDLKSNAGALGSLIKQEKLKEVGLEKYAEKLKLLNYSRNGLLHFNFEQLKEAAMKILFNKSPPKGVKAVSFVMGVGEVETKPEDDYYTPTDDYTDWSRFAYFAYCLMHEITKELYGEHKRLQYLKEGLDDYDKKKKIETIEETYLNELYQKAYKKSDPGLGCTTRSQLLYLVLKKEGYGPKIIKYTVKGNSNKNFEDKKKLKHKSGHAFPSHVVVELDGYILDTNLPKAYLREQWEKDVISYDGEEKIICLEEGKIDYNLCKQYAEQLGLTQTLKTLDWDKNA